MLNFDRDHPYVFISYKSDDKEIIEKNVDYLQSVYGLNLWYDADLTAGRNWDDEAAPILVHPNCRAVLLFASELALMSPNVRKELDFARDFKKPIIPINFSKEAFLDVVVDSITRKYQDSNWAGVKTALSLVKTHLPPEKTFLYLHQETYYPELIKSICRTAPEIHINDGQILDQKKTMWFQAEHTEKAAVSTTQPASQEAPEVLTEIPASSAAEPAAPIQEAPESLPAAVPDAPESPACKKAYTTTGDITFSIYGQEYTENQAGMMLTVFREVIRRHQDAADDLIGQLTCASEVDYEDEKNRNDSMPTYFRGCKTFRLTAVGKQICIGTAYSYSDKLKLIAKLFAITGEDPAVLEGVELPDVRLRAPRSADAQDSQESSKPGGRGEALTYHFYNYDGVGNQSELMYDVYSEVLKRHPDKLDEAVERLTSLTLTDYTLPENRGDGMPPYFRNSRSYVVEGRTFCVGASYGIKDKLVQIAKLLSICGEPLDMLTIDGMEFPPAVGKRGRRSGTSGSGPEEL